MIVVGLGSCALKQSQTGSPAPPPLTVGSITTLPAQADATTRSDPASASTFQERRTAAAFQPSSSPPAPPEDSLALRPGFPPEQPEPIATAQIQRSCACSNLLCEQSMQTCVGRLPEPKPELLQIDTNSLGFATRLSP